MTAAWRPRTIPPALVERYRDGGWWRGGTLGRLVARALADHPDATVAIHSRTRPWSGTYADIDDEARRLASLLRDEGVEPGSAVAFQFPNWREAVVSFAAVALGGYVLVPIVHIYGRREVSFILAQSGAVAYLSPRSQGHVDHRAIVDDAAPAGLRLHIELADDAATTPDTPTTAADDAGSAGVRRIGWGATRDVEPLVDPVAVADDDVVVLAYTSGTTSDPKGVIHDHRTLLSELQHMAAWMTPGRANLMGSPVAHATGMIGAVLGPLSVGGDIHLIDRWDPGHALEVMLANGIGGGTGASVFLAGLLDHPDFSPAHAASMGRVGLGGAPVPVALGERAATHGIAIIRAYGSTEHPSITGCAFDDPARLRHHTDGRPLRGVEIELRDPLGAPVPAGTPGEIHSRGPDLCVGYTDPTLNRAFDGDGWYRTGDIGVLDDDGCLTITDRAGDLIIRGGENLSPAEIEDVLATVPGVAEVAVVAAPDDRLGEHACAVLRLRDGQAALTVADLVPHLEAAGLARQKWPEEVLIVDDLPRTASGKVRKVDLRAGLRRRSEQGGALR